MQKLTGTWHGNIYTIRLHPGQKDDHSWILYVIEGSDGKKFTTFEKNKADLLRGIKGRVSIDWELNNRNGRTITNVTKYRHSTSQKLPPH